MRRARRDLASFLHDAADSLFDHASETLPLFKLSGYHLSVKASGEVGAVDRLDGDEDLTFHKLLEIVAEALNLASSRTDHHTWAGGINDDLNPTGVALGDDSVDTGIFKAVSDLPS